MVVVVVVTRQCRDCDLNPRPSAPESSMLTIQLTSHPRLVPTANVQAFTISITVEHKGQNLRWLSALSMNITSPLSMGITHVSLFEQCSLA